MRKQKHEPVVRRKNKRKPSAYLWLTFCLRMVYVPAYVLAYVASPGRP